MAIFPGTLDNFNGSMADAIEAELNALLLADGLPGLPMEDNADRRDRRRLFVAIARGVVSHLKARETSFVITYHDGTATHVTTPVIGVTL